MQQWHAYTITLRVGHRVVVWTRFAPNPVHLIVSAQAVCQREFPGRNDVQITYWERTTV